MPLSGPVVLEISCDIFRNKQPLPLRRDCIYANVKTVTKKGMLLALSISPSKRDTAEERVKNYQCFRTFAIIYTAFH